MLMRIVPVVQQIAMQAGEVILPYFDQRVSFTCKDDGTPVTLADKAADVLITQQLSQLMPDVPVLSEESLQPISTEDRLGWQRLWLVDPLDGTRQFIRGDAGFSVNIALVEGHDPVLGVVYSPVDRVGYAAVRGQGAWRWDDHSVRSIHVSVVAEPVRVLTGFTKAQRGIMTRTFLSALGDYHLIEQGSAIKICRVAAGEADVYPRFGLTSEWDTAAAQLILEESGGALINLSRQALRYNQRETLENPPFVAVGQVNYPWPIEAVRAVT